MKQDCNSQETERYAPVDIYPDQQLVDAAQGGDRTAYNRLIQQYQSAIIGVCIRLLGRDDGLDAAQETFVKAWLSLGRFRSESRFGTWLYRIAINTCRSCQRSWWSRIMKFAAGGSRRDQPADNPVEEWLAAPDALSSPETALNKKRVRLRIRDEIRSLPPQQREAVVLRDIHGLTYDEISVILGTLPGTVKSRLARARETLRISLHDIQNEVHDG